MEGREVVEEEGEEAGLRRWMESRMKGEEAEGEAPQESKRGPVEGEEEESLCWAGEAVERTCQVGMEEEEEVQRRELWRVEEVEGHLGPWLEEEVGGLSCGVVEGEEGHLWMEEVEELVSVARF